MNNTHFVSLTHTHTGARSVSFVSYKNSRLFLFNSLHIPASAAGMASPASKTKKHPYNWVRPRTAYKCVCMCVCVCVCTSIPCVALYIHTPDRYVTLSKLACRNNRGTWYSHHSLLNTHTHTHTYAHAQMHWSSRADGPYTVSDPAPPLVPALLKASKRVMTQPQTSITSVFFFFFFFNILNVWLIDVKRWDSNSWHY